MLGVCVSWDEGWCPRMVTGEKGKGVVVVDVDGGGEVSEVVDVLGVSGRTSVDGVLGELVGGAL